MAADDAVVVVVVVSAPPPPKPEPAPASSRLATALDYLLVASLWVIGASAAALTVANRTSGEDSPVYRALEHALEGALLLFALAVVAWCLQDLATALRLVKEFVADAVAVVKNKKIPDGWKVSGALTREQLAVVLSGHALALFWLLDLVGLLMRVVPGEECHRIGAALIDLGILGVSAIVCFIVVPLAVLGIRKNKDWRSNIAKSEAKTIKEDVRDQHEAQVSDLKFPNI